MDYGGSLGEVSIVYFGVYLLLSLVLCNLFIAVVTEVYPAASQQSERQWNVLLTESISEEVAREYRKKRYSHACVPPLRLTLFVFHTI
jgi:hypothetical protein